MARKKHLQGVDETDLEIIEEKMRETSNGQPYSDSTILSTNYSFKINLKCKNQKQKDFLNLLKNDSYQIVIGLGSAGSGKSMISLAYALNTIKIGQTSQFRHIVCMIPTCPAGNMNIGFLKGTLEEKIEPYLQADGHTMEKILELSGNTSCKSTIDGLFRNGIIRYELVNFSRGKTFDNTLILVNEAENYSKEEMLLILTRVGEGSKLILTGDLQQCDRQDIKRSKSKSGLEYACDKLKDLEEFAMVEFGPEDVVRNPIITKILKLWND